MTKKKVEAAQVPFKVDHQKMIIIALSKSISAFNNVDEIVGEKIFKGNVKQKVLQFVKWFTDFNNKVYTVYYDTNPKYFEDLVSVFDGFNTKMEVKNKNVDNLALFYMKMMSIRKDMMMSAFSDSRETYIFCQACILKIDRLMANKFWGGIKTIVEEKKEVRDLIDSFGTDIYLLH